MTDGILSDLEIYTIHFNPSEYKKHQRLLYMGSVMSQLLRQSYFFDHADGGLTYSDALSEMAQFFKSGRHYSDLWDELAYDLEEVYGSSIKSTDKK